MIRQAAMVLALASACGAHGQTLTLRGPAGQARTLTSSDLAALPRHGAELPREGGLAPEPCEGWALGDLLALVGAPAGPLRGPALAQAIVARGADGYRVVLGAAEADPATRPTPVIVADRCQGQPLDEHEGPLRLVVQGDRRPARSVRTLVEIDLTPLP